jgi:uncharacterized repeat protein (TIGR03803 family)
MKKILLFTLAILFLQSTLNAQTSGIYMYGTTSEGGANGLGTIYRVDQYGNNYQKVYDFADSTGGNPAAGLTLAKGKLYGATLSGGTLVNGATVVVGSFFSFDPITKTFTVLKYLDNLSTIGWVIKDAPILASNGLLYGHSESSYDGTFTGYGKLFSYNPVTGVFDTITTWNANTGTVESKLMQASNGKIYMISKNGGTYQKGSVMTYDITSGTITTLFSSLGWCPGSEPIPWPSDFEAATNNPLFEASNGKVYLTSKIGGSGNEGRANRYDLSGTGKIVIQDFAQALTGQGIFPSGGYLELGGFLYGATSKGITPLDSYGTFYKINLSTTEVTFIKTLDIFEGENPMGTFVKSPTVNRIYTTCRLGGAYGKGSIIEHDLTLNSFTVKHSFNTADGIKPERNGLTVVDHSTLGVGVNDVALVNAVSIHPNPTSNSFTIGMDNLESIEIFNLLGQIMQTAENTNTVNIENLETGTYLVKLKSQNKTYTAKLIKD